MGGCAYSTRHAHGTVGAAAVFQNRAELLSDAVSESQVQQPEMACGLSQHCYYDEYYYYKLLTITNC